MRPNSTKKHSHLRSSFKVLILTKYKAKLKEIVSFNNAITTYLMVKPKQRFNMPLENNYNTASGIINADKNFYSILSTDFVKESFEVKNTLVSD